MDSLYWRWTIFFKDLLYTILCSLCLCTLSGKCLHAFIHFVADVISVFFCFFCFFYNNLLEMNLGVMFVVLHHVVRVCDTYCCDVSMSVITGARRR